MGAINIGSLQLLFPDVSPLTFWLAIGGGIFIILALGVYAAMVFYFGKAFRKYLTAKMRRLSGIIQVYELENVKFHLADLLPGGLFHDTEGIIKKPVVAKSIATINGVPTVLTWRVTPRLPGVYTAALERLIALGYNKIEDIEDKMDEGKIKGSDFLLNKTPSIITKAKGSIFWYIVLVIGIALTIGGRMLSNYIVLGIGIVATGIAVAMCLKQLTTKKTDDKIDDYNLTYDDFIALHERVVNRNSVKVTIADILDFSERYLDEHPISSISEKIANQIQQRNMEGKWMKYAFIIIGITVFMVMAIKAYKVFTAVKP